jgi:hypothetical protein
MSLFSMGLRHSHVNGEEALEENFSNSSLPLRERIKVRGAVKSLFFVLLTASPILEKKILPAKGRI